MKAKLVLNRETLRTLTEKELSNVAGGDTPTRPCASYETFQSIFGNPPIPIPDDPGDFPEIGYLTREGIELERQAAAKPLPASSPHFFDNMKQFTHHELDADELMEDIEAYREVLDELASRGTGTVAFRH